MTLTSLKKYSESGTKMHELMRELYPICRSLTGNGIRRTLEILRREIPLTVHEVPSGTRAFDWTVPKEWNIRDAYIKNSKGEKIVDFNDSNLHVLIYSTPVSKKLTLEELKPHIHTIEEHPDWIPYRTSYYNENWGFCMTYNQYQSLQEDTYEVVIDSELKDGALTYGEYYIKGEIEDEVLFSSYLCHPSLCNDNLSGTVLMAHLAKHLSQAKLKYSYRFLFIPETIGAITWLSRNENNVGRIKHGLVATCVGDNGALTYKRSRRGDADIDKAVEKVLNDSGVLFSIMDFFPSGSDERQFCSPGFDLPVGSLMRTPYAHFPEYHSSADNLDFICPESMADSLEKYKATVSILESNKKYINLNPKCEPQLGKRGLYSKISVYNQGGQRELAMFWVLNMSDGTHSILDIAIRSNIQYKDVKAVADELFKCGLLKEA